MPLRRNRLASVLAMLAMALQAFWPLIAQARPNNPSLLVPVCTIDGATHYVELATGKSPVQDPSALHGDHCKLCVFGGDRNVTLVPREVVVFVVSDSKDVKVVAVPVSFAAPANHPAAQPRAPPVFS